MSELHFLGLFADHHQQHNSQQAASQNQHSSVRQFSMRQECGLATVRETLAHPGTKGDASERVWLELLQKYLSKGSFKSNLESFWSNNLLQMRCRMKQVCFAEMPWAVRVVIGLATFNLWWSFEEFAIDRFGVRRYLPNYKFGRLGDRDLIVALGIAAAIGWLSVARQRSAR